MTVLIDTPVPSTAGESRTELETERAIALQGAPQQTAAGATASDPSRAGAQHHCEELIAIFDALFADRYNTVLVRGGAEPVYRPAGAEHCQHRLIFAHGFFASALHEISHWCVAGPERRQLEDFGYWYQPDGRSADQQAAFEVVEVKPQALEWIFSKACGYRFRVSTDNLSGEATDNRAFKRNVHRQVLEYLQRGLAERPRLLVQRLTQRYRQPYPQAQHFSVRELD